MVARANPVDALVDARAKQARLRKVIAALRETILAGGCSLLGEENAARIVDVRGAKFSVRRSSSRAIRTKAR